MDQNEKKHQNHGRILIVLLLLVTAAAVCVTVWALFFRSEEKVLAPDYAPIEKEEHAETIENDTEEKLDKPEGGGSVSLTYSDEISIDLSEKCANLYFANPGKSNQDMVVQLMIQDTVIVQSGTLAPGNQVSKLDLLDGAEKQLSAGGYEGKFVILFYDQDSREKAMVNTEIPVSITVSE